MGIPEKIGGAFRGTAPPMDRTDISFLERPQREPGGFQNRSDDHLAVLSLLILGLQDLFGRLMRIIGIFYHFPLWLKLLLLRLKCLLPDLLFFT
jgi:hypothetical protein